MDEDGPEIEALEHAAAWRLRLVDADPSDAASATAARLLETLAADLRRNAYADLRAELQGIGGWLEESDAVSDFAEAAASYRARIGVSVMPEDGGAYLRELLEIARSLF